MRKLIIIIFLYSLSQAGTFKVEHPGVGGVNSYYGDTYLNSNEARDLINFDIDDGDLVKRPGFASVYAGSLSSCDGIFGYYDVDGEARLLAAKYVADTGYIFYSNPNGFTFSADSIAYLYAYKTPVFGYDWVPFLDAVFGSSGYNVPIIYSKERWSTLCLPTPGAPMISVINQSGNINGTVSYRLHFKAHGNSDLGYPGPSSVYSFTNGNEVVLWNFPVRGANNPLAATDTVQITRTKADGAVYYKVEQVAIHWTDQYDYTYIDTFSDSGLGSAISLSTCCKDSIAVPGQPYNGTGTWTNPPFNGDSTFYISLAYYDSINKIEGENGPMLAIDSPNGQFLYNFGRRIYDSGWSSNKIGIANALICYISEYSDTTRLRAFDTAYFGSALDYILFNMESDQDSATLWTTIDRPPYMLNNKIPFKYMAHSFSRLWGAGDADYPSRLYYSGRTDTGMIEYWDNLFDYIALDENDGDKIMGMTATEKGLFVFKGYSTWLILGTDPDYNMRAEKLSGDIGAVSNNTIAQVAGSVCFLSPDGKIYQNLKEISDKVWGSFKDLSIATLSAATAIAYKDEYWLNVNDTLFIYNINDGRWRKYKWGITPKYFAYYDITPSSDYAKKQRLIFTEDSSDSLFEFDYNDTCTTDGSNAIPLLYESPYLSKIENQIQMVGGRIDLDMDSGQSIYLRLLNIDKDTVCKITLTSSAMDADNIYDFKLSSPVGPGFYFVIRGEPSGEVRIKRYELDYVDYGSY